MKIKYLIAFILCASPIVSFAHTLSVGQLVPAVTVAAHGELFVENTKITYQEWSSDQLPNKVRVVQAIAGRTSAKKMNDALMSAIADSQFSESEYQTTTIINQDDAMWGTSSLVKSSAEDSKNEFPWSSIVLDKDGNVASTWQLQEKTSTIILLDKNGKVIFIKEGSLEQSEIDLIIRLISEQLQA